MKKLAVALVVLGSSVCSVGCSSAPPEDSARTESKIQDQAQPPEVCFFFQYAGSSYNVCDGPKGNFLSTYRHFADVASGPQNAGSAESIDLTKAVPAIGLPLGEPRYDDGLKQWVQVFERVAMNGGPCEDGRACLMHLGRIDAQRTFNETIGNWTEDCSSPVLVPRPLRCLDADFAETYERQGGLEFYGWPISHVMQCKVWPTNETTSCFWTERAKLAWDGHQWIGEQLARKIFGSEELGR